MQMIHNTCTHARTHAHTHTATINRYCYCFKANIYLAIIICFIFLSIPPTSIDTIVNDSSLASDYNSYYLTQQGDQLTASIDTCET